MWLVPSEYFARPILCRTRFTIPAMWTVPKISNILFCHPKIWIVCLLLLLSASEVVLKIEFEDPEDLLLIDSRQLGVFHYPIPGYIVSPKDETKRFSGVFHFFLRGVSVKEGIEISGFVVFLDSTKARLWGGIKHENPSILVHWNPRVFVRDPWGKEYEVTLTRAHEAKRPIHVQVLLPPELVEASLHVAKYNRYFSINTLIETSKKTTPSTGPPQVYNVIGQYHSLPQDVSIRMIQLHIDYHLRLGISGDMLYVTTEYVKYLAAATELEDYMKNQLLLPVLWDFFPRVDGMLHYDQSMVYHHAMLAMWRRNMYLFLTDFDELLALPEPANIVDVLTEGCLKNIHQVLIDSFGTYCAQCLENDKKGAAAVEQEYVMDTPGLGPLMEYTLRSEKIIGLPKILAHADYVTHIFVHSGYIIPGMAGTTERVGSDRKCVWIAHLRNMFGAREADRSLMVDDNSWLWAVKQVAPGVTLPQFGRRTPGDHEEDQLER